MTRILSALVAGAGGGALFFVGMTLLASFLPWTESDPLIFGAAAAMLGLFVAFSKRSPGDRSEHGS